MKSNLWVVMLIAVASVGASEKEWSSDGFNRQLSEQFEVTVEGGPIAGFHEMRYQVSTDRKLSVERARQLLAGLAKAISEEVNNSPCLSSHLPERPYPMERIGVMLTSECAREHRTGDDMAYLTMQGGIIQYFRTEKGDEPRSLYEISAETWDDALVCIETGQECDPLCLGTWIVIDPADGSLDKGLADEGVAQAVADVIRNIMKNQQLKIDEDD
jgi:hypothetical protein